MGAMSNLLVAYHSYDGQTTKIADHIAGGLRERGLDVDLEDVAHSPSVDGYDGVVVGDSIRLGRNSRSFVRYLRSQRSQLERVPCALFDVSMTAAGDDEEHHRIADGFVQKFVDRTGVHPGLVAHFAGALRYTRYGWITKRVIRSIASREGNATDTTRDREYTDWDAVDRFVDSIVERMGAARATGRERSR